MKSGEMIAAERHRGIDVADRLARKCRPSRYCPSTTHHAPQMANSKKWSIDRVMRRSMPSGGAEVVAEASEIAAPASATKDAKFIDSQTPTRTGADRAAGGDRCQGGGNAGQRILTLTTGKRKRGAGQPQDRLPAEPNRESGLNLES